LIEASSSSIATNRTSITKNAAAKKKPTQTQGKELFGDVSSTAGATVIELNMCSPFRQ
jgi:hypothetical protein